MTYNPGFDLEPPDPVPEVGEILLPLCITQQQLLLIIECIELGGLSLGLGRQGAHIAPIWRALANLDNPSCGADETEQCITHAPYSSLLTYAPGGNPFLYDPNDDTPTGYAEKPFYVYTPSDLPSWLPDWVTGNLAGLRPGDVVVTPEALIPGVSFPRNIASFLNPGDGLPKITIEVAGAASVTLRLLQVPQGGQVLIYFDDQILSTDVVETASVSFNDVSLNDFLELVFDYELYREVVVEREVPQGAQKINILFVPDIGTAEVFGFGGGFRSFDICGAITPECETTLIRVSPEDSCQVQQLVGGVWTDAFRLDACAVPGQDGADGAPAPVPDVRIVPINGGRVVEFDMDADGTYEDSFTILDGANAAPIPRIAVNRIGDAVTVDFDMDADGNTDASFTVFDGQDGADGQDGVSPPTPRIVPIRVDDPPGALIQFDIDNNGVFENAVRINDGISPAGATPPPAPPTGGFTDTDYCAAAYYNSEKFTTLALSALDNAARNGSFLNWAEKLNVGVAATVEGIFNYINLPGASSFYAVVKSYQQTEIDIVEAELLLLRDTLRNTIYCDQTFSASAIDTALAETPALTQNTIDVVNSLRSTLTETLWNTWTAIGIVDNRDADCAQISCGSTGSYDFDFTGANANGFALDPDAPLGAFGALEQPGWRSQPAGGNEYTVNVVRTIPSTNFTEVTLTAFTDVSVFGSGIYTRVILENSNGDEVLNFNIVPYDSVDRERTITGVYNDVTTIRLQERHINQLHVIGFERLQLS